MTASGPAGPRPVHRFPPATLEAVVEPVHPTQRMRLPRPRIGPDPLDRMAWFRENPR